MKQNRLNLSRNRTSPGNQTAVCHAIFRINQTLRKPAYRRRCVRSEQTCGQTVCIWNRASMERFGDARWGLSMLTVVIISKSLLLVGSWLHYFYLNFHKKNDNWYSRQLRIIQLIETILMTVRNFSRAFSDKVPMLNKSIILKFIDSEILWLCSILKNKAKKLFNFFCLTCENW